MKLFQTMSQEDQFFLNNTMIGPLKQDLKLILKAVNFAPTHKKTEPWRFKVLQNVIKMILVNLSEKYKNTTTKFSEFKFER